MRRRHGRCARVVHPEFIDSEKVGVLAAHNAGLIGVVRESEVDAVAWLRAWGVSKWRVA